MNRRARAALLFSAGMLVGWLVASRAARAPLPLPERRHPITVRRADEKSFYLVPYAVSVDGRSEQVGPRGDGRLWLLHFDGARVQVAATEEPDPR